MDSHILEYGENTNANPSSDVVDIAILLPRRERLIVRAAGTDGHAASVVMMLLIWLVVLFQFSGSILVIAFTWNTPARRFFMWSGVAGIGSGLGLLLHWSFAKRKRFRRRDAVLLPSTEIATGLQERRVFLWIGLGLAMNFLLGTILAFLIDDWRYVLGFLIFGDGVAWIYFGLIILPHMATSLIMQVEFEALFAQVTHAVKTSDDSHYERIIEVEETVKMLKNGWRIFLHMHVVFAGISVTAALLAEFTSFSTFEGSDRWFQLCGIQFGNHPVLSMSFFVVQVLVVADYNQQVLRLKRTTDSNTVHRLLDQRMANLQISTWGVVISHSRVKALMLTACLSSAWKFVVPILF